MNKKIIYIIISFVILCLLFIFAYSDIIFQEKYPFEIFKGIIKLDEKVGYIKIKDDPEIYLSQTKNEKIIQYIEIKYDVKFKEQMGSGYIFDGKDYKIVLVSRQFTIYYRIWSLNKIFLVDK